MVSATKTNSLETSNLRMGLVKTLMALGFKNVTDLADMTDEQILSFEGVGRKSLQCIRIEVAWVKKLQNDEELVRLHESGQDRLLRIIGRLTQLCDDNGLGEKARAVVSEESRA